jgi:hypothetical protein
MGIVQFMKMKRAVVTLREATMVKCFKAARLSVEEFYVY